MSHMEKKHLTPCRKLHQCFYNIFFCVSDTALPSVVHPVNHAISMLLHLGLHVMQKHWFVIG